MGLDSLEAVLHEQVKDLMSAEQQLVEALPKVSAAASSPELKKALDEHLEETRGHVKRLEEVAGKLGVEGTTTCKAMKGLIAEGEEIVKEDGDPSAKDAALIGAAQRVEHYEIAAYGTAKTLAKELDHGDAADLLSQTLDEESAADSLLTKIATGGLMRGGVNDQAAS
jgi:ferritin-like metal-binding protein YciE